MKKLLKSALAFALCLALVAAIVPASVFASIPPERIPGKIYPGCFLIKLNEPFYGTEAEFVAMFPEVEFWNRDMWGWGRQVYTLQPGATAFLSSGDEITVTEADFGKIFEINLEKDTSNAVREAIAALEGNPLVDYTETLDYFNHNQIEVCFYEPYEGDITELFSFMEIKSVTEGTSAMRQIAAEQGREVNDFIKAKINKEFIIYLADRSSDAVFDALKNLNGCELVKSVFVQYYDDDSYRPCDIRNQNDCEGVIIPPEEDEATVTDALGVLRIAAGLAPATPEAIALYDKDGDGVITVTDALLVLRIAAKLA